MRSVNASKFHRKFRGSEAEGSAVPWTSLGERSGVIHSKFVIPTGA
jgi:hypothetical protein